MALHNALEEAIDETGEAFQQFQKARGKFREEVRNELASVEAASKKIVAEFTRIVVALKGIQEVYGSGEFASAVANAERLAAALRQLQELNNSRITFAVIDNKPDHEHV